MDHESTKPTALSHGLITYLVEVADQLSGLGAVGRVLQMVEPLLNQVGQGVSFTNSPTIMPFHSAQLLNIVQHDSLNVETIPYNKKLF